MEIISIFLTMAGFVIGLGAVTVIDMHGFMGRKSGYWTEATIRTHKITKPLIWLGTFLVLLGHLFMYRNGFMNYDEFYLRILIITILVLNGVFLSFVVSRALLKQEREGRAQELLPKVLQNKITVSFVVSFLGWWSLVYLFIKIIVS